MGHLRYPVHNETDKQTDRLPQATRGWLVPSFCFPQEAPSTQGCQLSSQKGGTGDTGLCGKDGGIWGVPGTGLSPALQWPSHAPAHGTACADTGPGSLLAPCPWHQAGCGLPPPLKMMLASRPRAKSSLTSI